MVRLRRVYDPPGPNEGTRVLVDRLWPRGIKKDDLAFDHWMKDLAPSNALRTWFGHDPERFDEFARRYREELKDGAGREQFDQLRALAKKGTLTLLFGAKDETHNQAVVLQGLLGKKSARTPGRSTRKAKTAPKRSR